MFQQVYPVSTIRKAIDTYALVKSFRKAERVCGIGKSTIQRWWTAFHALSIRQRLQKQKRSRRKRAPKYPALEKLLQNLFSSPTLKFITLRAIQKALEAHFPAQSPCIAWLFTALRKAKISRRRFQRTHICPKSPFQLKEIYQQFNDSLVPLKSEEIVCIDETGFSNAGNATYGYYPKGKVPESIRVAKKERCSVVMAIHPADGVICHQKQAKAFNKETFSTFVKDVLLPVLPSTTKAVLMDNIRFHRSNQVLQLFEAKGILPLFIPPYSPRCNPIEEVFAQLKRLFRRQDFTSSSFPDQVDIAIRELKEYKDFSCYYKHARDHVQTTCHTLGL